MRRRLGIAIAFLVAGCASSPPSAPTASTVAPAVSPEGTARPAVPTPDGPSPGVASLAPVRVDASLLDRLPAAVDGAAAQPDPVTAGEVAGDAALRAQVQAIAIAIYVAPEVSGSTGDYAVATVVHLRPGVFSDTFFRDWRDTFDAGVCEQAGGVSTRAETTIAERPVHIGTCVGGITTYHLHLADDDLIVSIQGVGEGRLGERIVAGVTE